MFHEKEKLLYSLSELLSVVTLLTLIYLHNLYKASFTEREMRFRDWLKDLRHALAHPIEWAKRYSDAKKAKEQQKQEREQRRSRSPSHSRSPSPVALHNTRLSTDTASACYSEYDGRSTNSSHSASPDTRPQFRSINIQQVSEPRPVYIKSEEASTDRHSSGAPRGVQAGSLDRRQTERLDRKRAKQEGRNQGEGSRRERSQRRESPQRESRQGEHRRGRTPG